MEKAKKRMALRVLLPVVGVIAVIGAIFGASYAGVRLLSGSFDARFKARLQAQRVWQNTQTQRIPQTALHNVMMNHLTQPRTEGKVPKLLLVGWDGALATAVGNKAGQPNSAIAALAAQGGLWLGQTGGAQPGDQECRTAPGWCSLFTGVWADVHGVYNNSDTMDADVPNIFSQLTQEGKQVRFAFSWGQHLAVTYKNLPQLPQVFVPQKDDAGTEAAMLQAIQSGADAVLGTLEYTDHAGHASGYSADNPLYVKAVNRADAAAGRLTAAVQTRAAQHNEDWLVIYTTDHGGFALDHKDPTMMESTTFFAANKVIF
ncbi:MAG: alkaline phosphatase family protein [Oscillospiraceae bacterium]|jgi:hypothetical protein|nr:alkaline phosphatase family protein [Oscillospiraceae bacterium]